MTCVIVNHSRMSSLLSWFSYERFWVVTSAEVFVVLSGLVLGMVYHHKLARGGWLAVVKALSRRALTLYLVFVGVTVSILILSLAGIDVQSLTSWDDGAASWFLDPRTMNAAAWRDVALMRHGPWAFEIVGLYVWLVLAAVPCVLALSVLGWQPLLVLSWAAYLWYRIAPHPLTNAEFESAFPLLAWQLLFVHGVAIGYHREQVSAYVARTSRIVPVAVAAACAAFAVFALSNPSMTGPRWLHWDLVSAERFTYLYNEYFTLPSLGIGRLLNLAAGLPLGYAVLTLAWRIARPLGAIFVTLGQRSLGAFVLHVYGLLLLAHLPHSDEFWINTVLQVALIVIIAALLNGMSSVRLNRRVIIAAPAQRLAA